MRHKAQCGSGHEKLSGWLGVHADRTYMLKFVLILMSALLLLAGCGKQQARISLERVVDWGLLELSLNTPKTLSLGEGKDCTLTVVSVSDGNLQIRIETREQLAENELPPGSDPGTPIESVNTLTTTVPAGVQVVISEGKRTVRFTATLKPQ
ncbi:hypothetical protein SDC9_192514 [bioreactor metagenome]|uniref:Uncharacterized protein n=1 Tax=bioreactor metagenome TaxID=1076179 RepID=A0A645I0Z1_9ZZZZ